MSVNPTQPFKVKIVKMVKSREANTHTFPESENNESSENNEKS